MTDEERETLSADFEWLETTGERLEAGEEYSANDEDGARLHRSARWLGFELAYVEATLKEQEGQARLIVEMRERLLVSGRRLTAAVADLSMARKQRDVALLLKAQETLRGIAESDPVEFHRKIALDFLATTERGEQ